jgi:uncharacterized membrane protein (UPF0127 family)
LKFAALVCLLLIVLAPACTSGPNDGLPVLTIVNGDGEEHRLRVQIAYTAEERQRGLAYRETLGRDHGMLFVFEGNMPGFWMKDTWIPLSAAFITGCGEIVALADMEPFSFEVHNTTRPYRFGLEANRGWFTDKGIGPGARVELPKDLRSSACG